MWTNFIFDDFRVIVCNPVFPIHQVASPLLFVKHNLGAIVVSYVLADLTNNKTNH